MPSWFFQVCHRAAFLALCYSWFTSMKCDHISITVNSYVIPYMQYIWWTLSLANWNVMQICRPLLVCRTLFINRKTTQQSATDFQWCPANNTIQNAYKKHETKIHSYKKHRTNITTQTGRYWMYIASWRFIIYVTIISVGIH